MDARFGREDVGSADRLLRREADAGQFCDEMAQRCQFGGVDPQFVYTVPSKTLAPRITRPKSVKGKNTAVEINSWADNAEIMKLIDQVVKEVYK